MFTGQRNRIRTTGLHISGTGSERDNYGCTTTIKGSSNRVSHSVNFYMHLQVFWSRKKNLVHKEQLNGHRIVCQLWTVVCSRGRIFITDLEPTMYSPGQTLKWPGKSPGPANDTWQREHAKRTFSSTMYGTGGNFKFLILCAFIRVF